MKSSEWRRQRRKADLRHFEIFRHGPIVIYTRLPAGGTYYPICTFPASSECLIGISDTFSTFLFTGIRHLAHCTPTKACLLCAAPAGMDLYIQVHARRLLPSAVSWISEDHLFYTALFLKQVKHTVPCSLIQYNVIAKCQYSCTRNVLLCHAHSSHIHANHKTSLSYNTTANIRVKGHS